MTPQDSTAVLPPAASTPTSALVQADAHDRITAWNAGAVALLGYAADAAVGQTLQMLCPGFCQAEEGLLHESSRSLQPVGPLETTRRHRDGHAVSLRLWRVPLADAEGRFAGTVTTLYPSVRAVQPAAHDVNNLPWAQHFASLVENTDDAVITKTLDGIITSWNPGAERLFGWSAEEMVGQPLLRLFPADRVDEEVQILARVAKGEKVDHFETERLRKDGSTLQVSATISPVRDASGQVVGASKIARDISVRVQAERVIMHHATTDPVTSLPNRRAFGLALNKALEDADADGRGLALLMIDLDHFKAVNDSLGHTAGDKLLRQVARRIKDAVRRRDHVARQGGDEFAVLLEDVGGEDEVMALARRIRDALVEPIELAGRAVQVGASVGVALFPEDGRTAATLLQHADEAMYASKTAGGVHPVRLTAAQQAAARDRVQLLDDLRNAVAFGQLALAYQPIVDLQSRRIRKVEALARWTHPVRGPIPPAVFIPLAEGAGLLQRIGDWVFREAARQAAAWRAEGLTELQVSINLSPKQLHAGDLYFEGWFRHLKALNLPGSSLIIELTEDMLVDNSPPTLRVLGALREHALTIAIDDFGTGYSNLNALGALDAQYLKIDRGFVMALPESERSQSLCRAITSLAHALGLQVVAEGIETQAQADFLRSIGCEHGQGYLFARPMFAPELGNMLRAA